MSSFMIQGGTAGQLKRLAKVSSKVSDKLKNMRPGMKRVSVFLDQWVQANFRTEGGKVGGWKPFKDGGRYVKGVLDTSAKLLQDTGAMKASYKAFSSAKNAGIGTKLHYAEIQDETRRTLPEGPDVADDIKDILADYVRKDVADPIDEAFRK